MPDKPANTLSCFDLPADLVERARRAVENALGVELVPLLDREEITVTATVTEEAAEAVLRLAAHYLSAPALEPRADSGVPRPLPVADLGDVLAGEVAVSGDL